MKFKDNIQIAEKLIFFMKIVSYSYLFIYLHTRRRLHRGLGARAASGQCHGGRKDSEPPEKFKEPKN